MDRIPTGFNADEVPAAEPLDPGINPEDTWIVFDAAMTTIDTVDLTEPILDAETGQTVSQLVLASGPDTLVLRRGRLHTDHGKHGAAAV